MADDGPVRQETDNVSRLAIGEVNLPGVTPLMLGSHGASLAGSAIDNHVPEIELLTAR